MADILYDPECGSLARYFLDDTADKAKVQELAGVIQQAIEDWIEDRRDADTFIALTSPPKPGNLQIAGSTGSPIVTIYHDGRVEVNPLYTLDEAANAFWRTVIDLNPIWKEKRDATDNH